MPDQSVTSFAGYLMTITFTEYRGSLVGLVPEFVLANTNNVFSISSMAQAPDQPIYGGYYKLQMGTEFVKI